MKKIIILAVALLVVLMAIYWIVSRWPKEPTPNEDGHIITQFSLSESSSNAMAAPGGSEYDCFSLYENLLEIETTERGEKITIELDQSEREKLEQELLALIKTYSLRRWDGYDEWMDVLDDSHTFTLSVTYADGKEINAYGDHMFPDGYREVFEAVQSIFTKYENNA